MKFRDTNDKIHYYGAFGLMLLFSILFISTLPTGGLMNILAALLKAFLCTNAAGLLFEFLEDIILPHWSSSFWDGKPGWIKQHFSGDNWDWEDIKLNLYGSSIVHPINTFIMWIDSKRQPK